MGVEKSIRLSERWTDRESERGRGYQGQARRDQRPVGKMTSQWVTRP